MRHLIIYTLLVVSVLAGTAPAWGQTGGSGMSAAEARRQARLFDEHTVRMGETAFSISRGYALSPVTLAEDNPGIDLTQIRVGQVLLIRKKERGRTDPVTVAREWQRMTAAGEAEDAAADKNVGGNVAADGGQNDPSTGGSHRDSLWSSRLGDPGNQGNYPPGRGWGEGGNRNTGEGLGLDGGSVPGGYWNRGGRRDFSSGGTPRIALMLPLTGTGANAAGNDFTDLYKGALLALENLKAGGRSAIVTVWDSGRSAEKMESIVTSAEFMNTDLIIGPVYEEELEPAVRFGEFFGVPVVSPLAAARRLDSEVLYQMAPDQATKYDKLRPLWEGDANVIVVSSGAGADDAEFEREITAELGRRSYGRFTIGQGDFASHIDWERPNVLVVLAGSELSVNMALSTISSSYTNISERRSRRADITVIGNSKWANYSGVSLDQRLLFKLNTKFVTSYYIDRSDRETRLFEARYLEVYGDFPSRAAFRGYDAVALFAGALFESGFSFAERLESVGTTPLATPYRFVQGGASGGAGASGAFGEGASRLAEAPGFGGLPGFANLPERTEAQKHVNDQWTLVSFGNNYNITTQ